MSDTLVITSDRIERIIFKELDVEDKFGGKFRCSVKFQDLGDWVSFGTTKSQRLSAKVKGDWVQVKEGDTVTVVASRNGKYINAKQSDIRIEAAKTSPVSSEAKVVTSAPAKPTNAATAPAGRRMELVAGVEVGMAINNACQAFAHGKIEKSEIEEFALSILGISDRLRYGAPTKEVDDTPDIPEKPAKPKAKAKKPEVKSAPVAEIDGDDLSFGGVDELDDDVPF